MVFPIRCEQLEFSCDRNINSTSDLDIDTLEAGSGREVCYLWTNYSIHRHP